MQWRLVVVAQFADLMVFGTKKRMHGALLLHQIEYLDKSLQKRQFSFWKIDPFHQKFYLC